MKLLSHKYTSLGHDVHTKRIRSYVNTHTIVTGMKHAGKMTLIENSHTMVHVVDMNGAESRSKELFDSILAGQVLCVRNIDTLKRNSQMLLCHLIDKYGACVKFMFTTRTINICNKLLSRCVVYRIPALSRNEVADISKHICTTENITVNEQSYEQLTKCTTVHDVLLTLDMIRYNIKGDQCRWKPLISKLCANLASADHLMVRNTLAQVYFNAVDLADTIKYGCECLLVSDDLQYNAQILQKASKYDVSIRKGKKDIFHAEAFFQECKNLISQYEKC